MRLRLFAIGVGLALLAQPAAAQSVAAGPAIVRAPHDARDVRTNLFWRRADRLWSGMLPVMGCGPRVLDEATGPLDLEGPVRRATFERRGELIAELSGPRLLSRTILTRARTCAAEAADHTTLPVLLTAEVQPWETFHGALDACLRRTDTARHVGSMTLWIDTSCNW